MTRKLRSFPQPKLFQGLALRVQKKFQQAKLVYVLKGKILDVVIDLRKKSKTFGKYFSIILSQIICI